MKIGSPVSIQRAAYYAGWFGAPARVIHIRERDERRGAPALAPRRADDAAHLTLLMAQAMAEPRPIDLAAANAAYAAAQRDDGAILLSIAV